jgi:hypothetical protein
MNVKIQAIIINQVNNYTLSAFPEERTKTLISELNVHYEKINNYIESEISGENIDIELINSLAKLNEISRLSSVQIIKAYSGDYRFTIDLLESVIALLQCQAGNSSIREKLRVLGWQLMDKLYNYSFDNLVYDALVYHWLKSKNLIRSVSLRAWSSPLSKPNNKIVFESTEQELDKFYEKNKQKLYEIMTFELNQSSELQDPFSEQQNQDYYHYHQTLKAIEI